jgi:hypothetical protein
VVYNKPMLFLEAHFLSTSFCLAVK